MAKLSLPFFFLALILVASGCGQLGGGSDGWVSSGGELFQGRQNPWWLKNVSTVGYCIRVDGASSSIAPSTVEKAFKRALEYWKYEFQTPVDRFFETNLPSGPARSGVSSERRTESLGVGKQTFRPVACAKADLEVVVGSGALSQSQRLFLGPTLPRQLAAAVRTSYNAESLRGRGFIFLASDRGSDVPAAIRAAGIKSPLASEHFVTLLLAHELGHTFGIPHQGVKSSLMADRFPEQLLKADYWRHEGERPSDYYFIPSFYSTPRLWLTCATAERLTKASEFFGVKFGQNPKADGCPTFLLDAENKRILVSVTKFGEAKEGQENGDDDFKPRPLGYIEKLTLTNTFSTPLLVELNPLQTVFRGVVADFLQGPPMLRTSAGPGVFRTTKDGPVRAIHLQIDAADCWRTEFAGMVDGELAPLFVGDSGCH